MKSFKTVRQDEGFTLVEMLVVIAIIGILAALLLPVLNQAKARAKRIECVSDLREIGIAYHAFANDHNGKYPTQVSTNDGGASEFVDAGYQVGGTFYFSYKYVSPLAGILVSPRLLACPADLTRWPATNFNQFNSSNLSYYIGIPPDANDPRVILAADTGLPVQATNAADTIVHVPAGSPRPWDSPHLSGGNILFADAHVEQSYNAIVSSEESIPEDLVRPSLRGSASVLSGSPPSGGGNPPGGGGNPPGGGGNPPGGGGNPPGGGGNPPGGGGGYPPGGGGGQPARQSPGTIPGGAASQASETSSPASAHAMAQAGMTAGQSGLTDATSSSVAGSNHRVGGGLSASEQNPVEISNSLPERVEVETNASDHATVSPPDDGSTMSPANREAAHVLRYALAVTYFIILLLLLLYAAYRYWRWKEAAERKRRNRQPRPTSAP